MELPSNEDFAFLILPDADLLILLVKQQNAPHEVRLFGNRSGMASLANVLLWLHANSSREFLSITALPFVRNPEAINLVVCVTDEDASPELAGRIRRLDRLSQFEWIVGEADLRGAALTAHHLASLPGHEYDLLPYDDGLVRDARLHLRLTDGSPQSRICEHY